MCTSPGGGPWGPPQLVSAKAIWGGELFVPLKGVCPECLSCFPIVRQAVQSPRDTGAKIGCRETEQLHGWRVSSSYAAFYCLKTVTFFLFLTIPLLPNIRNFEFLEPE